MNYSITYLVVEVKLRKEVREDAQNDASGTE